MRQEGKKRPEPKGVEQADEKGEKEDVGQESTGRWGSWGNDRATGRATGSGPRGWNPDAGRGRGGTLGRGPPGGAGDHQTFLRLFPGGSTGTEATAAASPPWPGPIAATQTPGHTASRPRRSRAGTRSPRRPCPLAVSASVSPSPTAPRDPSPCTSGPQAPGHGPLGAEQASRRPGKRKHGTAPLEFPTFSPDPDAAGADGTSRALPSLPPASWSHSSGWRLPRKAESQGG